MIVVLLIIVILIIIVVAGNKKKPANPNTPQNNFIVSKQPSAKALEMAHDYFGKEWQQYLLTKKASFKQPSHFHKTVALALEQLSENERSKLFLTFLGVNSKTGREKGAFAISFSVDFNNYENLYFATYNLLKLACFTTPNMCTTFKDLIVMGRNETNKEEKDDSIIDVTGQSYQIDTSTQSNTQENDRATTYNYNTYDSNENRLGKLYKEKLNLSTQEASWLNKFYNPNNVFLDIEGACQETIKFYLATVKELNKQLRKKETTLTKEVDFLRTEMIKLQCETYRLPYENHSDYSYMKERAEGEIYLLIFRKGENVVREAYGNKRKVSEDFANFYQSLTQEFENRIGATTDQVVQSLIPSIAPPDEKTENELNAQHVTRWKTQFEKLQNSFSDTNRQPFIDGVYALEKVNQKNPSIENIFFEASKFIAKYDITEALKFYIHYLHYDLKSDKVDNKQLTKTIQKSLFKTNEQLNEFGVIVADLVKTKDLQKALAEVVKIHQTKRKKIQLDVTAIQEVQLQDRETVEKLNEYLHDEFETEDTTVKTKEINQEEIKLEIEIKHEETKTSAFADGLTLTEMQANTIAFIAERSFTISSSEIDAYCKSKGVFKNHLIESINESCYDLLDDVLIEEDGDSYVLNDNYFKKISAQ